MDSITEYFWRGSSSEIMHYSFPLQTNLPAFFLNQWEQLVANSGRVIKLRDNRLEKSSLMGILYLAKKSGEHVGVRLPVELDGFYNIGDFYVFDKGQPKAHVRLDEPNDFSTQKQLDLELVEDYKLYNQMLELAIEKSKLSLKVKQL